MLTLNPGAMSKFPPTSQHGDLDNNNHVKQLRHVFEFQTEQARKQPKPPKTIGLNTLKVPPPTLPKPKFTHRGQTRSESDIVVDDSPDNGLVISQHKECVCEPQEERSPFDEDDGPSKHVLDERLNNTPTNSRRAIVSRPWSYHEMYTPKYKSDRAAGGPTQSSHRGEGEGKKPASSNATKSRKNSDDTSGTRRRKLSSSRRKSKAQSQSVRSGPRVKDMSIEFEQNSASLVSAEGSDPVDKGLSVLKSRVPNDSFKRQLEQIVVAPPNSRQGSQKDTAGRYKPKKPSVESKPMGSLSKRDADYIEIVSASRYGCRGDNNKQQENSWKETRKRNGDEGGGRPASPVQSSTEEEGIYDVIQDAKPTAIWYNSIVENHEEDEDDDDDYGGMDSTFDFDDSDFDSDESCDRIYDLVKDSDIDSGGDERVATVVTVVEEPAPEPSAFSQAVHETEEDEIYENLLQVRKRQNDPGQPISRNSSPTPTRLDRVKDDLPTRSKSLPPHIRTRRRDSFSDPVCYSDVPGSDDDTLDDATSWQSPTLREWMGFGNKLRWCEMPRVKNSGLLKKLSPKQIKLQEALFEILASEAFYINRLDIIISVFYESREFSFFHSPQAVITENQREELFLNIQDIWDISREFLAALERLWDRHVMLNCSVCDVITKFAEDKFQCYVKYTVEKGHQERKMNELKLNQRYAEALHKMEHDPKCNRLNFFSYMLEPFQRFLRYPLLLKEVVKHLKDTEEDNEHSEEIRRAEKALETIEPIVQQSNELVDIQRKQDKVRDIAASLIYKDPSKKFEFNDDGRRLVKEGDFDRLLPDLPRVKIHLILFDDVIFITQPKSADDRYEVITYVPRIMVETRPFPGSAPHQGLDHDSLWVLVVLEGDDDNVTYDLSSEDSTNAKQWRELLTPEVEEENDLITYKDWYPYMMRLQKATSCRDVPRVVFSAEDEVRVISVMKDGDFYLVDRQSDGARGWVKKTLCKPVADDVSRAEKLRIFCRRMDRCGSFSSTASPRDRRSTVSNT